MKFLFKGKIYNGQNWIYGELWRVLGTQTYRIIELEG